jgi:hypothetical protein
MHRRPVPVVAGYLDMIVEVKVYFRCAQKKGFKINVVSRPRGKKNT